MGKLHEILAVEKGTKTRVYREVTDAHHALKPGNTKLSGISRSYKPKDDDGDQLPSETTRLQLRTEEILAQVARATSELLDITLTKDAANTEAKADVVVDGVTIATDVPVTYLLFLEKQLTDLTTILTTLPVLDPSEEWEWDDIANAYVTSSQTVRTKKIPKSFVRAAATDKHPAQVDLYHEDVVVGYWTTTKSSGALTQARVAELRDRVIKLSNATKMAREQANSIEITNQYIGSKLFGYLFR